MRCRQTSREVEGPAQRGAGETGWCLQTPENGRDQRGDGRWVGGAVQATLARDEENFQRKAIVRAESRYVPCQAEAGRVLDMRATSRG